jgi:hypothetical protein
MQSFAEQQAFFDAQRAGLCQALARGGGSAAIDFVLAHPDETERRVLFIFGRAAFIDRHLPGHAAPVMAVPVPLDVFIAFADAGIAECLRQARAAVEEETRQRRIDSANVISYNLAADLADCWDGTQPREQRHFARGFKAAQDCIQWRLELDKGPGPFAIAYWARGMHQLSLGDTGSAVESFHTGLEFSRQAAEDAGQSREVNADGEFGVILATGYLGLAGMSAGLAWGKARYAEAQAAFTGQLEQTEKKEDAQFGLEQLQVVWKRYFHATASTRAS